MSYIECYSHMTGKNVKYNLIGVKLKHQKKNQDYGCSTDNYSNVYCNTSPYKISTLYQAPGSPVSRTLDIYGTSGFINQSYDASGVLSSEYHNSNTGKNPVISSRTYDIEDMQEGENTEDLFSTDMIKVRITTVKKKASEVITSGWAYTDFQKLDGTYENKDNLYLISNVIMDFILLSNNEIVGSVDLMAHQYGGFFPTRFSMNSELFNLIDFDPQYQAELLYSHYYSLWFSMSQQTNKGIMVNGSKETTKHDFVGLIHSLMAGEGWYAYRNSYNFKQFQIQKSGGGSLTDREINIFNVNGDILYFRHKIQTQPNEFIQFNKGYANGGLCFTPDDQTAWIDSYMAEKGYVYADPSGTHTTFMGNVFNQSPILMPMYNDMYIPLTNDIKEGTAPDPDPDPEEEELEEADDENTTYDNSLPPDITSGHEQFTFESSSNIPWTEAIEGYGYVKPCFSNYVFDHYYKTQDGSVHEKGSAWEMLNDLTNISISNMFQSVKKFVTGHPTLDELVARVYVLPFEFNDVIETNDCERNAVPYEAWMDSSGALTGQLDFSSGNFSRINYYVLYLRKWINVNLGSVTISKVFNNYLDYKTSYKLHLPYCNEVIEIDPNMLFRNDASSGTIYMRGIIDVDTGSMTVQVAFKYESGGVTSTDLYYQTTYQIAVDLTAIISDKVASIGNATKTAAAISAAAAAALVTQGKSLLTYNKSFDLAEFQAEKQKEIIDHRAAKRTELNNQQKEQWESEQARREAENERNRAAQKEYLKDMARISIYNRTGKVVD